MKKVKIHRLYTALLLAALIAPPMVAQERQNSRRKDKEAGTFLQLRAKNITQALRFHSVSIKLLKYNIAIILAL